MVDSTDVVRYRLYRQSPTDATMQLAATSDIQRGTIPGLQTGTLYGLQVAGVNSLNVEGPRSEIAYVRPSVFGVSVDGSAVFTSNPVVSVELSSGGFNQVRLAESPAQLGQTNYQLVPGGLVLTFQFTGGDGVKTVYAQYRDAVSGSESDVVSDDIQLDRQASIASVTQDTGGAVKTAGQTIHFTLTAGEVEGFATVDIGNARTGLRLYDDGTHGDAVAADGTYELSYVVEATIDCNDVPVTGRFTDRAGNTAPSVQAAGLVTISNPPPAVTLSDPVNQGGGRVLLLWEQSSIPDFQAYRVWYAPTSPVLASAQRILDTTIVSRTVSTTVVDNLPVSSTRYFMIQVVDAAGNVSPPSNEKSIVVSGPAPSSARLLPKP